LGFVQRYVFEDYGWLLIAGLARGLHAGSIRQELGYQEPVAIEEAIRRTIPWEREISPVIGSRSQIDYAAEDAAVAAYNC
jgi:hypothetical protein